MATYQDDDIDTMLADWNQEIIIGGITKLCLFAERDEVALEHEGGAGQLMRITVATVKTTDFPTIKGEDPVTVDGRDFTVWRRRLLDEGALTELWLRSIEAPS